MNSLEQQISDFFEPLKKSLTAIQNTRGEIPEQRITALRTTLRENTATAYVMLSNTISNPQERQQLQDNLIETYCNFYDVLHKLNLEIVGGSEAVLDDPSLYKKRAETELPRIFKEFPQTNQKDTKDDKQAIQDLTNAIQNIKILPPAPTLKPVIPGSQNGFKASVHEDRIAKVIAFLDENNIKHGDPQKGQAPAQNEMREESYALITIYNQDNQAIGEVAVNDYSGQAVFVWAPPQDKEFLSNNKKILQYHRKGIEPIDGVTYIERIPFDKKGEWKITLLQAIQDIQEQNIPNIAATTNAALQVSNPPSKQEITNSNQKVIDAFLKNPEKTSEALREAFQEVFGKPTPEITIKDIRNNQIPVTITLPDETQVTVGSTRSLYYAFQNQQQCPSLLSVLWNKEALTRHSGPKIEACLFSNDAKESEATKQAIRDAVKEVEGVFPKKNGSLSEWVGNFCKVLNSQTLFAAQKNTVRQAIRTLFDSDENMEISMDFLINKISEQYGSGREAQNAIDVFQAGLAQTMGANYPPILGEVPNHKPIITLKTIQKHNPVLNIRLPMGEAVKIYMASLEDMLGNKGSFPEWVGKFLEVLNSDQLSSEQKIAVKKAISTLFVDSENIEISLDFLMKNISRKYGSQYGSWQDTIDAFQGELSDAMGEHYPPVLSQSRNKSTTLAMILESPLAEKRYNNAQLRAALQENPEKRQAIIDEIRKQVGPDVKLTGSDTTISFEFGNPPIKWQGPPQELDTLLHNCNRMHPDIPTLQEIQKMQITAAASAASSSPATDVVQFLTTKQQDSMG